jgi:hypothetical protein
MFPKYFHHGDGLLPQFLHFEVCNLNWLLHVAQIRDQLNILIINYMIRICKVLPELRDMKYVRNAL